jgi:UDP-N-acetylglucosamine 2-epimerase (non-hydrolysing)
VKKLAVVFGTRPEIIKLAPVVREAKVQDVFQTYVVSTGQHSSLKDIAVQEEQLLVDCDLQLMTPNQTLASFNAKALEALDNLYLRENIEGVIVQGDTSSAFIAALAAYYRQIPVFHVEAGLRSGDLYSPFPEEGNRKLIAQIASMSFAPTFESEGNLLREGIPTNRVLRTGNTIVDSLLGILGGTEPRFNGQLLDSFDLFDEFVICTAHRRENHSKLRELVKAISALAQERPGTCFWLPLHPNPHVMSVLGGLMNQYSNVLVLEPLSHRQFVFLLSKASLIVSDSGGVQEEALSLSKKILVLRDNTERPEVLTSGLGKLVAFDAESIRAAVLEGLTTTHVPVGFINPFGDGSASKYICQRIAEALEA